METKVVSARVPENVLRRIDELAAEQKISRADLLAKVIEAGSLSPEEAGRQRRLNNSWKYVNSRLRRAEDDLIYAIGSSISLCVTWGANIPLELRKELAPQFIDNVIDAANRACSVADLLAMLAAGVASDSDDLDRKALESFLAKEKSNAMERNYERCLKSYKSLVRKAK